MEWSGRGGDSGSPLSLSVSLSLPYVVCSVYACEWARLPFEADTEHGISPRGSHCRRKEERKNLTQSFLPSDPTLDQYLVG